MKREREREKKKSEKESIKFLAHVLQGTLQIALLVITIWYTAKIGD